jgi:hypothetical protein
MASHDTTPDHLQKTERKNKQFSHRHAARTARNRSRSEPERAQTRQGTVRGSAHVPSTLAHSTPPPCHTDTRPLADTLDTHGPPPPLHTTNSRHSALTLRTLGLGDCGAVAPAPHHIRAHPRFEVHAQHMRFCLQTTHVPARIDTETRPQQGQKDQEARARPPLFPFTPPPLPPVQYL